MNIDQLTSILENAMDVEENIEQLQMALNQLRVLKNEFSTLTTGIDQAAKNDFKANEPSKSFSEVEEKIIVINLAMETIYNKLYSVAIQLNTNNSHVCTELQNEYKKAIHPNTATFK